MRFISSLPPGRTACVAFRLALLDFWLCTSVCRASRAAGTGSGDVDMSLRREGCEEAGFLCGPRSLAGCGQKGSMNVASHPCFLLPWNSWKILGTASRSRFKHRRRRPRIRPNSPYSKERRKKTESTRTQERVGAVRFSSRIVIVDFFGLFLFVLPCCSSLSIYGEQPPFRP